MLVQPQCCYLSWGDSEAKEFITVHGGFDLLLGADVVFWPNAVPLLIQTVRCFLIRSVAIISFLLAYIVFNKTWYILLLNIT